MGFRQIGMALILFAGATITNAPAQTTVSADDTSIAAQDAGRTMSAPADMLAAPSALINTNTSDSVALTSGTYSVFHTSEGDFITRLLPEAAPHAVENFIGLATGNKTWTHPVTALQTTRPLYNNTTIFKIIPNVMIVGGDPINRGEGDSGYLIPLEMDPHFKFDRPGMLAMDASGSKMSGSRFFVTLRQMPERDNNFTIFGQVVGGLDVVQRISNRPTKRPQTPLDPTLLEYVEIVRIPYNQKTTGTFRQENGIKTLSIDPHFQRLHEFPDDETTTSTTTTSATQSDTMPATFPAPPQ
jgi:peptidyl-prolyl cis-trans isomerase A (cyclophilin A)